MSKHAPGPEDVLIGRNAKMAGQTHPENEIQGGVPRRSYFCRSCGRKVVGTAVPKGWYRLTRASDVSYQTSQRLGLYCTARCLTMQMSRIEGIERDLDGRVEGMEDAFREAQR